jgi:hypothetical protein
MKRTPIKKSSKPMRRKALKPRGSKGLFPKKESKTEEWNRVKREILDPYFQENGLYWICELDYPMCIGTALPLQYAHSKKRGEIALDEPERTRELTEVIRACTECHGYIEDPTKISKSDMYYIVVTTIEKRNKRLSRWKNVVA